MATFILTCFDQPGRLPLRLAKRADHLAHVAAHGEIVRLAGPLLDEAGDMSGSHFLLEAPDLAAVRAFHEIRPLRDRQPLFPRRHAPLPPGGGERALEGGAERSFRQARS